MTEIEQRKQQRQAECDEMTMAKKQLKMKLDVLSNIHAKRDVKVRQDLAREQEMRANLEGEFRNILKNIIKIIMSKFDLGHLLATFKKLKIFF